MEPFRFAWIYTKTGERNRAGSRTHQQRRNIARSRPYFELRHPGRSKPYQGHLWVTSYTVLSLLVHASPHLSVPVGDEGQVKKLPDSCMAEVSFYYSSAGPEAAPEALPHSAQSIATRHCTIGRSCLVFRYKKLQSPLPKASAELS